MINLHKKSCPYIHPEFPRYASNTNCDRGHGSSSKTIKVVSYNIKNSNKIDQAVNLMNRHDLGKADILCLQEMNYTGVRAIAEAFNLNYVYYPAAIHYGKDFGNAILSRWPLYNDRKIILPHQNTNNTHRIAVSAEFNIEHQKILIFSVHLGVTIGQKQRFEQLQTILQTIQQQSDKIIMAGDFNTLTKSHTRIVHKPLREFNFLHATDNIDWTYSHWYLLNKKAVLDYIFVYGMIPTSSGKINDYSPSDHLPIWVDLKLTDTST